MKKITLRLVMIGLVATSLLASCKKNENNGTADGMGFKALTEQGGGSRTHGVVTPDGSEIEVRWTAYDQILVDNGSTVLPFELTSGADNTTGEFHTANCPTDYFEAAQFNAIYPVANADGTENTISGTTAIFNLPSAQAYLVGSFAEKSMPMMASSTNQTLQFKNALGGLCFPLVGDGMHVTQVVVTSASADDYLWGVFSANYNDGNPTLTYVSGGNNSIALNCDVTLDATDATDFYIMVPAGTLENGFTVEAYDGTTKILRKSTDWSANPHENFIPRNVVRVLDTNLNVVVSNLTVTTISPTHITTNSALGIGSVSGGIPEECGILYALASDLTDPANDLVLGGTGVTSLVPATPSANYDVDITGLTTDTEANPIVYYVRAWAKNEVGTIVYGDPIPFAPRKDYSAAPYNGKLPKTFSVGASTQVYFSMGNLQYQASTDSWKFAAKQFECIGEGNSNISETYDGWIDMFGWGTSGYNSGAVAYQPWSTSVVNTDYYSGGPLCNLTGTNANSDWGVYHSSTTVGHGSVITNGSVDSWRTLQSTNLDGNTAEWNYVVNERAITYRYARVQLVSVDRTASASGTNMIGVILFPDTYTWDPLVKNLTCNEIVDFDTNQLTEAEWSLLEQQGAVLFPAAGLRSGTEFRAFGEFGSYWSASYNPSYGANSFDFETDALRTASNHYRYYGFSVRLVTNAE